MLRLAVVLLGMVCYGLGNASQVSAEEVSYVATVDRNEVALNDTVTLTLALASSDPYKATDLKLPTTGTLKIVNSSESNFTSILLSGGNRNFQTVRQFVYVLQPTREGVTSIGKSSIEYQGKTYSTEPIQIRVTKARARAQRSPRQQWPFGGGSPFWDDDWDQRGRSPIDDFLQQRSMSIGEDDIFVKAYATPENVVLGQQVSLTLVVYSRVGASFSNVRWSKLDDFITLDRDVSNAKTDQKLIDGVMYHVKVLTQKALFPIKAGEITIDPIELDAEIGSQMFFGGGATRTLKTAPLKIKVAELPSEGRPKEFHQSNVGQFTLSTSVDATEVKLNQPITFTIMVRGVGNLQMIRTPDIGSLDKFRLVDTVVNVDVSKQGREVRGTRTSEYILMPLASGELTLPPVAFSYFDLQTNQYRTLTSEPISLRITPSDNAVGQNLPTQEVNLVTGGFDPTIRYDSSLSGFGNFFYQQPWFFPMLAMPPGVYLVVLFTGVMKSRLNRNQARNRMKKAWNRSRQRIKKANQLAASEKTADFYSELKTALMDGIEGRIGISPQGLTLGELKARLEEHGTSVDVAEQIGNEIENCDFGRFAPSTSPAEQMGACLERVRKVIKKIERQKVQPL